MKTALTLLLTFFIFTGCGSTPQVVQKQGKPKWTLVPPSDGIYGVGASERHVDGPNGQRLYAISVALDEIARQKKVKIDNVYEKLAVKNKQGASLSTRNYSIQSVEGVEVSAKIVDAYEDTKNDMLYILMKETK